MSALSACALRQVLLTSERLILKDEVEDAFWRLAQALDTHYQDKNPIVMVVMNGGLIPAAKLLSRVTFYHRMHYLHATRYKGTQGGALEWKHKPDISLTGEHVLLIDDIFDEGMTLRAVVEALKEDSPASIKTVALLNKTHSRKPRDFTLDFVGLHVPDRYVFGCGMDYHGYLRHLEDVWALKS